MDSMADDERGYGFGLVRTVYMLFASSASLLVGTLADTSGWFAGFGLVVCLLALSLLLLAAN
jgi:sugar phosphate permease